jgi:hypothetical protein
MRRIGLVALSLLALTACNGGDGGNPALTASPGTATPSSASPTASPTSAAASPTASLPPGCASPPALPAGATEIVASVSGGKVTTEKRTYDVKVGSAVRLLVTADVVDEVHVHGYDLHADTKAGCAAVIDFQARIPGEVEVELEKAHLKLFEVRAR